MSGQRAPLAIVRGPRKARAPVHRPHLLLLAQVPWRRVAQPHRAAMRPRDGLTGVARIVCGALRRS